jgi:hypothetical protein
VLINAADDTFAVLSDKDPTPERLAARQIAESIARRLLALVKRVIQTPDLSSGDRSDIVRELTGMESMTHDVADMFDLDETQ